jgi:hypothetical protein
MVDAWRNNDTVVPHDHGHITDVPAGLNRSNPAVMITKISINKAQPPAGGLDEKSLVASHETQCPFAGRKVRT